MRSTICFAAIMVACSQAATLQAETEQYRPSSRGGYGGPQRQPSYGGSQRQPSYGRSSYGQQSQSRMQNQYQRPQPQSRPQQSRYQPQQQSSSYGRSQSPSRYQNSGARQPIKQSSYGQQPRQPSYNRYSGAQSPQTGLRSTYQQPKPVTQQRSYGQPKYSSQAQIATPKPVASKIWGQSQTAPAPKPVVAHPWGQPQAAPAPKPVASSPYGQSYTAPTPKPVVANPWGQPQAAPAPKPAVANPWGQPQATPAPTPAPAVVADEKAVADPWTTQAVVAQPVQQPVYEPVDYSKPMTKPSFSAPTSPSFGGGFNTQFGGSEYGAPNFGNLKGFGAAADNAPDVVIGDAEKDYSLETPDIESGFKAGWEGFRLDDNAFGDQQASYGFQADQNLAAYKNEEKEDDEEIDISDIIGKALGEDGEPADEADVEGDAKVVSELGADADDDGVEDFMQEAYVDPTRNPFTGQYMGRPEREERKKREVRGERQRKGAYVARTPRSARTPRASRAAYVPKHRQQADVEDAAVNEDITPIIAEEKSDVEDLLKAPTEVVNHFDDTKADGDIYQGAKVWESLDGAFGVPTFPEYEDRTLSLQPEELDPEVLGFNVKTLTPPDGAKVPNYATVKVLYKGTLEDGTVFDESADRENPFEFQVGKGLVIKGWDEGIVQMHKGQKAIITCPPEYGYGEKGSGSGSIPGGATITFEVEVIDFTESETPPPLEKEDYMLRKYYMPGYVNTKPQKEYPPHIRQFKDYINNIGEFKKHDHVKQDYSPNTDFAPSTDGFGPDSSGFGPDIGNLSPDTSGYSQSTGNYGGYKPKSQNYGGYAPQGQSYGNFAPQGQSYGNYAPQGQSYGGYKPAVQSFGNFAPQGQSYGGFKPASQGSYKPTIGGYKPDVGGYTGSLSSW